MLKTIITYGVSILVFAGSVHVHLHNINSVTGDAICNVGGHDDDNYSSVHQCEKCLTSSINPNNPNYGDLTNDQYIISFFCSGKSVKKSFINYSLYGRPPPNLV